jgi:energy-coupling factor transporter ATP-binding protein EcfA2
MPAFQLAPGEPVVLIGPMGCGKSKVITFLIEDSGSNVIIDSKRHPDEWAAWGPRHGYVVTSDPAELSRHPKVVWQVTTHTLLDVEGFDKPGTPGYLWTEGLLRIMQRGSTIVVFDELVQQLPAGRPHPSAVQILTQGAAYRVTAFGCSQFANRVETMLIRGAVHCFCFPLLAFDAEQIRQKRGLPFPAEELPRHGFWYHRTSTPSWVGCAPVPLEDWYVRNAGS